MLAELRAMGTTGWLSYKEDAATNALRYGSGAALYVSPPGSTRFTKRRDAYTPDDQHPLFDDPDQEANRSVEEHNDSDFGGRWLHVAAQQLHEPETARLPQRGAVSAAA